MSFHLRVVNGEESGERLESGTVYVRRILALVSGARIDFRNCLNICHEQKLSTPQYDLWAFARENRALFDEFFSLAINDRESERGIELVNMLIMLVYLRKVEQLAYRNAPIVAWSVLVLSNNSDCQKKLLQVAGELAEKCAFPLATDKSTQNSRVNGETRWVRKKLRKALG